jgi:hypothetical protein
MAKLPPPGEGRAFALDDEVALRLASPTGFEPVLPP